MDLALAILPSRGVEVLQLAGEELYWILDAEKRPCILAGYGSTQPVKQAKVHFMIKFRVSTSVRGRSTPIFNVVFAKDDNPVRHTRVARKNVKVLATGIPLEPPWADKKALCTLGAWLSQYYLKHIVAAGEGFQQQGLKFRDAGYARSLQSKCQQEGECGEESDDD